MADPAANPELVFCHSCENEWYRHEHGLVCPGCQSDFTEIIEQPASDPRLDPAHLPPDTQPQHPLQDHNPWEAPDPGEEDIDRFAYQRNGPGQPLGGTYRTTVRRTVTVDAQGNVIEDENEGAGAGGGGLMGLLGGAIGGVLQGVLGPAVQQALAQRQAQQQHQGQDQGGMVQTQQRQASPEQQQQGSGVTHRLSGPGYTIQVTSASMRGGFGGPALQPRDANNPQPLNPQPDHINEMMRQMFMNIGGFPPLPGQEPPRMGPAGFMFGQPQGIGPDFLQQMLAAATGGQAGDAVYSQDALDRIVTQLMEQHTTGNAPGPASDAAIKSLTLRPLVEADFGHDGKADCSICMSEVELGEVVTELPCGHWFHGECVGAWLRQTDTCPHCRRGIVAREGDGVRALGEEPAVDHNQPAAPTLQRPVGFPSASPVAGSSGGGGGVFRSMRNAFGGGGNTDSADNGSGNQS